MPGEMAEVSCPGVTGELASDCGGTDGEAEDSPGPLGFVETPLLSSKEMLGPPGPPGETADDSPEELELSEPGPPGPSEPGPLEPALLEPGPPGPSEELELPGPPPGSS